MCPCLDCIQVSVEYSENLIFIIRGQNYRPKLFINKKPNHNSLEPQIKLILPFNMK